MVALKNTALKYVHEYPQASQFIIRNSYVDDILITVKSLDAAKQLNRRMWNLFFIKESLRLNVEKFLAKDMNLKKR